MRLGLRRWLASAAVGITAFGGSSAVPRTPSGPGSSSLSVVEYAGQFTWSTQATRSPLAATVEMYEFGAPKV